MRIFLGFLIVAVALGGALWLHNAKLDKPVCRGVVPGDANAIVDCRRGNARIEHATPFLRPAKDSWQDPVAVVLAMAGIGAGGCTILR